MRRRAFIKGIAGSTIACPLASRAQQPTMPVMIFLKKPTLVAHLFFDVHPKFTKIK
jgi:hypothetical protein